MKFWKKKEDGKSTKKPFFYEKVTTCHKVFSIITSMIHALTILITAAMALADAEGTAYDVEGWKAVAITSVLVSVIQLATNVPYLLFWRNPRREKWSFYVWAVYHLFASLASLTLFFLAFYVVETHSAELRKSFWSQFKLKLEKAAATMEDMMICIDFLGLNCFFCAFLVLYPKLSKIWNQNSPENVNISLD